MKVGVGDSVYINQLGGAAGGRVTAIRRGLVSVYIGPGEGLFGVYKGWVGTERFKPDQVQVVKSAWRERQARREGR